MQKAVFKYAIVMLWNNYNGRWLCFGQQIEIGNSVDIDISLEKFETTEVVSMSDYEILS